MCKDFCENLCSCFGGKAKQKPKKKRKTKMKTTTTTHNKYGTNWEILIVKEPQMNPSQIDDQCITREVTVAKETYSDRTDLFKEVLKDYEFDAERDRLGEGTFAQVYRMTQKTTGEVFAFKVMKLIDKRGQSLSRFEMFKNEVFSLRKNPHKNIIKLIDHFVVKEVFLCFMVMVMEFATQGDLHQRLKPTNNGFTEEEAKTYFIQIANAMNFVHKNRITNGDLKLQNVLITKTIDTEHK